MTLLINAQNRNTGINHYNMFSTKSGFKAQWPIKPATNILHKMLRDNLHAKVINEDCYKTCLRNICILQNNEIRMCHVSI